MYTFCYRTDTDTRHQTPSPNTFPKIYPINRFLIQINLFQVLVDRYEDITHPDIIHSNPKASRDVSLYGYVRGTHLKPNMPVHIPGTGDFGTFF